MRACLLVLGLVASTQAFFVPRVMNVVGTPATSCRSSRYVCFLGLPEGGKEVGSSIIIT